MREQQSVPFWLLGVLLALLLILIGTRMGGGAENPVLVDTFRPEPTAPGGPPPGVELPQVNLPELPPNAQQALEELRDRFAGGQAVPALTPVATGIRARIEVSEVKRVDGNAQVRGTLENVADQPIEVPSTAFTFRDSAGVTYTLGGGSSTSVQPGQTAPFDLSVPLPEGRGLALVFTLSPDPPVEQTLIVETVEE